MRHLWHNKHFVYLKIKTQCCLYYIRYNLSNLRNTHENDLFKTNGKIKVITLVHYIERCVNVRGCSTYGRNFWWHSLGANNVLACRHWENHYGAKLVFVHRHPGTGKNKLISNLWLCAGIRELERLHWYQTCDGARVSEKWKDYIDTKQNFRIKSTPFIEYVKLQHNKF